jgi:hypothetical protein
MKEPEGYLGPHLFLAKIPAAWLGFLIWKNEYPNPYSAGDFSPQRESVLTPGVLSSVKSPALSSVPVTTNPL